MKSHLTCQRRLPSTRPLPRPQLAQRMSSMTTLQSISRMMVRYRLPGNTGRRRRRFGERCLSRPHLSPSLGPSVWLAHREQCCREGLRVPLTSSHWELVRWEDLPCSLLSPSLLLPLPRPVLAIPHPQSLGGCLRDTLRKQIIHLNSLNFPPRKEGSYRSCILTRRVANGVILLLKSQLLSQ